MADGEDGHRAALIAHRRRVIRTGALVAIAWSPWTLAGRVRRARATGDRWAWSAIALALLSAGLDLVVSHRRAAVSVDDGLAREARVRERRDRDPGRRDPVPVASVLPTGRTPAGCLAQLVVLVGGWVPAVRGWAQGPARPRGSPWWRPRPGPAWWTGWSLQRLPVDAASTAPRAAQIAHRRRQLLVLRGTGVTAAAIASWQTRIRPGLTDADPLCVAAGLVAVVKDVVVAVADHRLVPTVVDEHRARRRRHDAAVTALRAARAAGLPPPANPWRAEMLRAAVAVAVLAVTLVAQWRVVAGRPRRR